MPRHEPRAQPFVVPGRAAVVTPDAPLYRRCRPRRPQPRSTAVPACRPARASSLVARGRSSSAADGAALLEVQGLDAPDLHGFMRAADLAPATARRHASWGRSRDRRRLPERRRPGRRDQLSARACPRPPLADPDPQRRRRDAPRLDRNGSTATTTWDGLRDGDRGRRRHVRYLLDASDAWTNTGRPADRLDRVDTARPSLTVVTPAADAVTTFSPNGDGVRDSARVSRRDLGGGHDRRPRPQRRRHDRPHLHESTWGRQRRPSRGTAGPPMAPSSRTARTTSGSPRSTPRATPAPA